MGGLEVMDPRGTNGACRGYSKRQCVVLQRRTPGFNGAHQGGVVLYQLTQKWGGDWSAARGYVEPLRGRANLDVRTGALVEKILIEDGRATGVVNRRGGKRETLRAAGGVTLSAGAFNSPPILMLSGHGPEEHLAETTRKRVVWGKSVTIRVDHGGSR